jgi:hypothetical protein
MRAGGEARQYSGMRDAVVQIAKREGVAGFYRGILPSYLKVVPTTSITFYTYETCKKLFAANE